MMIRSAVMALCAVLMAGAVAAQEPSEVLFRDVRVFDGKSETLTAPTSVLVRGNLIAAIGPDTKPESAGATIIDGG